MILYSLLAIRLTLCKVNVDGTVDCSVPQGSVLGPLEFISYTEDVADVFRRNLVRHHLFADDKQLYRSGKISDIGRIRLHLSQCILNVRDSNAPRSR